MSNAGAIALCLEHKEFPESRCSRRAVYDERPLGDLDQWRAVLINKRTSIPQRLLSTIVNRPSTWTQIKMSTEQLTPHDHSLDPSHHPHANNANTLPSHAKTNKQASKPAPKTTTTTTTTNTLRPRPDLDPPPPQTQPSPTQQKKDPSPQTSSLPPRASHAHIAHNPRLLPIQGSSRNLNAQNPKNSSSLRHKKAQPRVAQPAPAPPARQTPQFEKTGGLLDRCAPVRCLGAPLWPSSPWDWEGTDAGGVRY